MATRGFPVEPPRALRERSDFRHDKPDTTPTPWVTVRWRMADGASVRGVGTGLVCAWRGRGFAPAGHPWSVFGSWRCDRCPHDRPISALSIPGRPGPSVWDEPRQQRVTF